MFDNVDELQADGSTFNSVGRDQYNAGRDLFITHNNTPTVTGMIIFPLCDAHLTYPNLRFKTIRL